MVLNSNNHVIVLASASPRRLELVRMLGIDHVVCPAKNEMDPPDGISPEEAVSMISQAKAREVAPLFSEEALILAADTIVCLEGRILGRPHSGEEAENMLKLLSGRRHEVYTGVTLLQHGDCCSRTECSYVTFRELDPDEIHRYVLTGEPLDKAGAYAAQGKGALFVRSIEGDFFNVMGLPLCLLGEMLKAKGVPVL